MASLEKAHSFYQARNFVHSLRYVDLALDRLKKLKDRPLDAISESLGRKCDALGFLRRDKEALEISQEKYNLWAVARGPAYPDTIEAAFALIQCSMRNHKYVDAELYARTLWEILHSTTHHFESDRIPDDKLQEYLGRGAKEYACSIWQLALAGGIPSPEEKKKRGEEAIALSRRSMEITTQVHGTESAYTASSMGTLASILDYFIGDCGIEAIRLIEQSIDIFAGVQGRMSMNVASAINNLGNVYCKRYQKAMASLDLEQALTNAELALPHYRDAAQIFNAINHVDIAEKARRNVVGLEEQCVALRTEKAATAAAAANSR